MLRLRSSYFVPYNHLVPYFTVVLIIFIVDIIQHFLTDNLVYGTPG